MKTVHSLQQMLASWVPEKDNADWVLGVIYKTEGSCYRKAGAMMLFSSDGHQLGILSGGCLESDVRRNARKVMQSQTALDLRYDDSDEDDAAFQLGVGCGGVVYLRLLPVNKDNNYAGLTQAHKALQHGQSVHWQLQFDRAAEEVNVRIAVHSLGSSRGNGLVAVGQQQWLQVFIKPEPHLLVVGGGTDAIPMTLFAAQLGWRVTLWDPRPSQARAEHFPHISQRLQLTSAAMLANFVREQQVNGAILMSHHKSIDSDALQAIHDVPLDYIAMLGPKHRKQEVMQLAGVQEHQIKALFSGPAGLNLGGELPESIALSIVAECHAVLHQQRGNMLSLNLEDTKGYAA